MMPLGLKEKTRKDIRMIRLNVERLVAECRVG